MPARATRPAVEATLTIALGARRAQQRQQRLGQPHLRVEVDRHRAPHVLVAAVGEARAPGGAGVVDEQVESPVVLEHVLADARGRVVVEQVDGDEADAAARRARSASAAQALLAPGDEHERRAGLAREAARGRFADAAGGAGDEHHACVVLVVDRFCHRLFGRAATRRCAPATRRGLACQIGNTMSSPALQRRPWRRLPAITASPRKREALELFRGLPRRYDALSAALSFWQDPRWRRALVSALAPRRGERVLDVATGTGMVAAELLARADCTVVGIDQSATMLAGARAARFASARRAGDSGRVELIAGGGGGAAVRGRELRRADVHVPAALRRRSGRDGARAGARGAPRRADGVAGVRRAAVAPARAAWRLYTAVGLPALGGLASREWAQVGRFLGPSIRGFYERHPLERS